MHEIQRRRRARPQGLWRDLPAIPVPDARRISRSPATRAPSASARRRRAAPTTRSISGPASRPTPSRSCPPITRPSSSTTCAARSCRARPRASARSPTACQVSRRGCRCCSLEGVTRAASPCSSSWRSPRPTPPRSTACIRAKGTIAVGSDADIVLWGSRAQGEPHQLDSTTQLRLTPYEGRELTGYPVMTLSRGEVVMDEGRMSGSAGRGRSKMRPPRARSRPPRAAAR